MYHGKEEMIHATTITFMKLNRMRSGPAPLAALVVARLHRRTDIEDFDCTRIAAMQPSLPQFYTHSLKKYI